MISTGVGTGMVIGYTFDVRIPYIRSVNNGGGVLKRVLWGSNHGQTRGAQAQHGYPPDILAKTWVRVGMSIYVILCVVGIGYG